MPLLDKHNTGKIFVFVNMDKMLYVTLRLSGILTTRKYIKIYITPVKTAPK